VRDAAARNSNSSRSSANTGHLMGRGRLLLWVGLGMVEAQCASSVDAHFAEAQCALSVDAQFASCVTRLVVGRGFEGRGWEVVSLFVGLLYR
jgi:hypothetical protein